MCVKTILAQSLIATTLLGFLSSSAAADTAADDTTRPNIDRLAREGTDFHRFTVASGVCSPSRTAVMTGHFPARYNIDGISQLKQLQGETSDGRSKPLFWKMKGHGKPGQSDSFHWVDYCSVDQNWKLLCNEDDSYCELYDIVADPLEQRDVQENHPQVVAELKQRLADWQASLPAAPDPKNFSSLRKQPAP